MGTYSCIFFQIKIHFAGSRGNSYRSSYRRKSSGRSYGSYHRYGRSVEEPLGVLLIGPVAGGLCLFGAAGYLFYPEKEVREKAGVIDEPMSAR